MSFVRPEVSSWLTRWREAIGAGVLTALGGISLWRGVAGYNWMQEVFGVILIIIGGLLFFAAVQRGRFFDANVGAGVVEVTERRITYLTSETGNFVDVAAITKLEIRHFPNVGGVWVLKQSEGGTLFIPTSAAGAENLFDAFSALPGIEPNKLISALKEKTNRRQIIWRQIPGFHPLT